MNEADNKLVKIDFSTLSLTAFKPRQVLLAEQQQKKSNPGLRMVKKLEEQLDRNAALIYSILSYLQKNGFSKTFKRFLKEAQVEQGDNWKTSLDLEDVYSIYLENSRDADKVSKAHLEQDVTLEKSADDSSGDAISKKKKKIKKGLENGGEGDNKGVSLTKKEDNKGESEGIDRSKDKKEKKKSKTVSFADEGQEPKKESDANETQAEDSKPESKKKKKKKGAAVSTESLDAGRETVNQGKSLEAPENGAKKELKKRNLSASDEKEKTNKSSDKGPKMVDEGEAQEASNIGAKKESKKRKLSASDENENKSVENSANGETKRRKTENSEVTKVDGSKKEDLMRNGIENSADEKSAGKQKDGSAQAKTAANAFQRVKADAVKFADERLQDNSYWAKNGAEIGYGAKAQEILGQVKGRDFRHEKTKKKRGSYRGGQIDLQSHSIKFNYDEEE